MFRRKNIILILFLVLVIFLINKMICHKNVSKQNDNEEVFIETNSDFSAKRTYTLSDLRTLFKVENYDMKKDKKFSVAIIDTGIFPHKALKNKIVFHKDFLYDKEFTYDDNGHGTAVAGIIAAESSEEKGLAPFVNIISLKVLDYNSMGNISDVISAIQWVIDNKEQYNIKIMNISIGIEASKEEKETLRQLCGEAYQKGVIIVSSAGNFNGMLKKYIPAEFENVLSVGSVEIENKEFTISNYSQSWKNLQKIVPDIYTLGTNIVTTKSNLLYKGTKQEQVRKENSYEAVTGTSFSTAIITGILCNLIYENPSASVEDIVNILFRKSDTIWNSEIKAHIPVVKELP